MGKLTLALLSGGVSSEREVSLNSGDQVYEALDKDKYNIIRFDPKTDLARLVEEAPGIDAALIILHGPYGEDGTVQGLLELLGIPYQGSGVLGSSLAMNKLAAKYLYEKAGLPVPPYIALQKGEPLDPAARGEQLGLPLVVKPNEAGSSVGMTIVKTVDAIEGAVAKAFAHDTTVLLESYIAGIELTGGVIGNRKLQALPLIEIIPDDEHEFFDYEAKYTAGITQEICPARVDDRITATAQTYAKTAHSALFCKGYSRTDMILKDNRIFVLETNTIPGMTATSLLPQAAKVAGYSFSRLLDELITLCIEEHQSKDGS
jgi:D-alanine-D-alanine ligase